MPRGAHSHPTRDSIPFTLLLTARAATISCARVALLFGIPHGSAKELHDAQWSARVLSDVQRNRAEHVPFLDVSQF